MKLYELYQTDEWASINTLNVNSRVLITDKPEFLAETAFKIVMEDPEGYEVKNPENIKDGFEMIEKIKNGEIQYLFVNEVELDEIDY